MVRQRSGQFAGIYLQAKVLRRDDSYRGLNHSNRWGPQNQTLIDAGNRDGVLAGYAFYNGLSGAQPAQSVCGHGDGAPDINGINIRQRDVDDGTPRATRCPNRR